MTAAGPTDEDVLELLRWFVRRTGDPQLAADLTAETFAAALLEDRPAELDRLAGEHLGEARRRGRAGHRARRRLGLRPGELDDATLDRIEALADDDTGDPAGAAAVVAPLGHALREAAARERRRGPPARRLAGAAAAVPGRALALVLAAVAVAGGVLAVARRPATTPRPAPGGVERFAAAPSLGAAAAGFGSVWLDDRAGQRLVRLDPATRDVGARVPVPSALSVAVGRTAVWALAGAGTAKLGGPLLRIDPRSGRVTARAALRTPGGAPFAGGRVLVAGDGVWVVGPAGALRFDAASARATTVVAPRSAYEVVDAAADGGRVHLAFGDGRLVGHDARTGRRTGAVRLAVSGRLVLTAGALVVLGGDGVARVDPATGRTLWEAGVRAAAVPPATGAPAVARRGVLWLPEEQPGRPGLRLSGLDLETGELRDSIALGDVFGPAALVAVGDDLWLTTQAGAVLVVRPRS